MAKEVYVIKGPGWDSGSLVRDRSWNRSPEDVANEIQSAYLKAEEQSGKIIASHVLQVAFEDSHRQASMGDYLFLVADIPEQK